MARTWETSNTELLAKWFTNAVRVDLSNNDLVFRVGEGVRKLFVLGSKVLQRVHVSQAVPGFVLMGAYTLQCPHHGAKLMIR